MSLQAYCHKWCLDTPLLIAQTPTSWVYRVLVGGQMAVLKLLTPVGVHDEAGGALALRHFAGNGAVRLLRHDTGAHLLEYVPGADLVGMAGEDEHATQILAGVLNQLHAAPRTMPAGVQTLRHRFRSLFHYARQTPETLFEQAARIVDALLSEPREVCVLHGDMHHANVLHSERGYIAIDPKGIYGERTYDACNILRNPNNVPLPDAGQLWHRLEQLTTHMGLIHERLLQYSIADACLSAVWSLEDGDDPARALHVARVLMGASIADDLT